MSPGATATSSNLLSTVEKLNGQENFQTWRSSIELAFTAMELWSYASVKQENYSGTGKEQELSTRINKEQQVRAYLLLTMNAENQMRFKHNNTAADVLIDVERAFKRTGIQHQGHCRRKLMSIMHKFENPVQTHLNQLRIAKEELVISGGKISDEDYGVLILQSLPVEYRTLVSTLSRMKELKVHDVEREVEEEERLLKGKWGTRGKSNTNSAFSFNSRPKVISRHGKKYSEH